MWAGHTSLAWGPHRQRLDRKLPCRPLLSPRSSLLQLNPTEVSLPAPQELSILHLLQQAPLARLRLPEQLQIRVQRLVRHWLLQLEP